MQILNSYQDIDNDVHQKINNGDLFTLSKKRVHHDNEFMMKFLAKNLFKYERVESCEEAYIYHDCRMVDKKELGEQFSGQRIEEIVFNWKTGMYYCQSYDGESYGEFGIREWGKQNSGKI